MTADNHLRNLGLHYMHEGNFIQARHIFKFLLKNIEDSSLYLCLATTENHLGNYEESILLYEKYLSLNPNDVTVLNNLGVTQEMLGNTDSAIQIWSKALEINLNDINILENLGLLFKKIGPLNKSLECFQRILTLDPTNFNSLVNKANVLLQMQKTTEALEYFEMARKINPKNLALLNGLSTAYLDTGNPERAIEFCSLASENFPESVNAWNLMGECHLRIGELDKAIEYFKNAVSLDPEDDASQNNLVRALHENRKNKLAIETSNSLLQITLSKRYANLKLRLMKISKVQLIHDIEQARYFVKCGYRLHGIDEFLSVADSIEKRLDLNESANEVNFDQGEYRLMKAYLTASFKFSPERPILRCLNPEIDWKKIEDSYLSGRDQIQFIDNFLTSDALEFFRDFAKLSKVWVVPYGNNYLGAFMRQGFISEAHLCLANELKLAMPSIFRDYRLEQLWGFKYESRMRRGIGVHADSAKINLNFWITPDHCNLDKESGGLIVYKKASPRDWTFSEYNSNSQKIYEFLGGENADCLKIPYRSNRAVLFDSALFHETDNLSFREEYESRRINMTYLFGVQLK